MSWRGIWAGLWPGKWQGGQTEAVADSASLTVLGAGSATFNAEVLDGTVPEVVPPVVIGGPSRPKLVPTQADWQAYYRRTSAKSENPADSPTSAKSEVSDISPRVSEYDQLAQQAEQARLALERAKARQEAEERAWYAMQAAVIRNAEEEARQAQIRLQAARDALLAQQAFDDYMQQQADMVFALRQQDDELALLMILLEA